MSVSQLHGKPRTAKALTLILTMVALSSALTRISVVPLVNKSDNAIIDWVGAAIPEAFFRESQSLTGVQAWEPAFLFSVDSTGWTMESDSLLKLHWGRWAWDAACGGDYSASGGAVTIALKVYSIKNGRVTRKKLSAQGRIESVAELCSGLFLQFLETIGYAPTAQERQALGRSPFSSAEAYATYVAGYGFEMRGNYCAAITAYNRAVEIDPGLTQALCRIGKLYAAGGNLDSAEKYIDRCASASSPSPVLTAEIADFYAQHALPEKALKFIRRHNDELDQTVVGMKAIGESLLLTGELQRAIAILNRALAQGAPDLETDFVLGKAYLAEGDFLKASDVFNRLVRFRPDSQRYYALLGTAYRNSGRLMESAKVLENADKLKADDVTILINLAQTYCAIGWLADARRLLSRAMEIEPGLPEIYVDLGVVYWQMGDRETAGAQFTRAGKLGAHLQSVDNNQGNILFLDGNAQKAVEWYLKAQKAGKKNEVVLLNLAKAYWSMSKLGKAASCFEQVLSISPDRPDVLIALAEIAEKRKKTNDAEGYYRKILELSPHNDSVLKRLTDMLIRQNRFKEALEPIEPYLVDFPNDKKMLLMQADLYDRMGWYEVSVMKYQFIVRDFPDSFEGYLGLGKSMFDLIRLKNVGDFDKAIYYLKTAVGLDRSSPEPEYIIGTIYMDYKNYTELALDNWKSSLAKASDPIMKKRLTDLIAKAGK
jgi:prepilin-type processing-associated H-X9-DG protein